MAGTAPREVGGIVVAAGADVKPLF
jgi:hypothetical protein